MISYRRTYRSGKGEAGLTIVELMVGIAVLAVLVIMSTMGMRVARERSFRVKAQNDIDEIFKSIQMLAMDTGDWPGHQAMDRAVSEPSNAEICNDGCGAAIGGPEAGIMATDGTYTNWGGPYMTRIPLDPWGNEYFFDTSYAVTNGGNEPCDGGVIPADCHYAAVVGSYGPNRGGRDAYDGDDIIRVASN